MKKYPTTGKKSIIAFNNVACKPIGEIKEKEWAKFNIYAQAGNFKVEARK
jgi:hypothetical protein